MTRSATVLCRAIVVAKSTAHVLVVLVGSSALTLLCFLALPLLQAISHTPSADTLLRDVDAAALPPPPPMEEELEEPEKPPEEKPPELTEEAEPLDLSQLELALDPGFGQGGMAGDFAVKLNAGGQGGRGGEADVDALFSLADLDQRPRAIYQSSPVITKELRKKAPGTVHVVFVVNAAGAVENPLVQHSSDPVFERPALAAVKQWKFEPGKRSGKTVRFRMRVPITFPHEG